MLLDSHGAEVNKKDWRGMTALIHASQGSHEEVVSILIQYGADADEVDQNGENALLKAVRRGNLKFVKFLTNEAKADLHTKLNGGKNILEHAQRWRSSAGPFKQIYEYLLSKVHSSKI